MAPPSLNEALCSRDAQVTLIATAAESLHLLGKSWSSNTCLLGASGPRTNTRRRKGTSAIAKILRADDTAVTPDQERIDKIAGFFQQLARTPALNDITLCWAVLCVFMLFPKSRTHVMTTTPAEFLVYFQGNGAAILPFDTRMMVLICGSKSTQAKTPIEIVVAEWQLYEIIRTRVGYN